MCSHCLKSRWLRKSYSIFGFSAPKLFENIWKNPLPIYVPTSVINNTVVPKITVLAPKVILFYRNDLFSSTFSLINCYADVCWPIVTTHYWTEIICSDFKLESEKSHHRPVPRYSFVLCCPKNFHLIISYRNSVFHFVGISS